MMKHSFKIAALLLSAVAALLLGSCSVKESAGVPSEAQAPVQFLSGDVLVTISSGAPLATKGLLDVDWYTVIGELNSTHYSLYVESKSSEDGLVINNIYTRSGVQLFSEAYMDGKFVGSEFTDIDDAAIDGIETKAARHEGETYVECVKRVHKLLKENAEETVDVTCEFVSCGAVAAVVSIVDCVEIESTDSEN